MLMSNQGNTLNSIAEMNKTMTANVRSKEVAKTQGNDYNSKKKMSTVAKNEIQLIAE